MLGVVSNLLKASEEESFECIPPPPKKTVERLTSTNEIITTLIRKACTEKINEHKILVGKLTRMRPKVSVRLISKVSKSSWFYIMDWIRVARDGVQ